jgi:hypothetical protein
MGKCAVFANRWLVGYLKTLSVRRLYSLGDVT